MVGVGAAVGFAPGDADPTESAPPGPPEVGCHMCVPARQSERLSLLLHVQALLKEADSTVLPAEECR